MRTTHLIQQKKIKKNPELDVLDVKNLHKVLLVGKQEVKDGFKSIREDLKRTTLALQSEFESLKALINERCMSRGMSFDMTMGDSFTQMLNGPSSSSHVSTSNILPAAAEQVPPPPVHEPLTGNMLLAADQAPPTPVHGPLTGNILLAAATQVG